MPSIDIDIDLHEFDNDDIICEIRSRWDVKKWKHFTEEERNEVMAIINNNEYGIYEPKSLDDILLSECIDRLKKRYPALEILKSIEHLEK